jgi:hypothetical protein
MSTETACFLFGIATTFLWVKGLKKGIMIGRIRWVRRDEDTFMFWLHAAFAGSVALGLLIMPMLTWAGFRR